ncbi:MAG: hypothetical protein ACRYFZ_25030 [Janthinobacterium lividum]
MLNFSANSPTYKYFGCVAALALCLTSCEQKQALPVSPTPMPTSSAQPDRYYLNAQVSSKEVIEQLDSKSITRMEVLKGQQAADYAHDASIKGVILVQTK